MRQPFIIPALQSLNWSLCACKRSHCERWAAPPVEHITIPVCSASVLLSELLNFSLPLESKLLVNWIFLPQPANGGMRACECVSHACTNTRCIPNPLVFGPDNMLIAAAVHSRLLIAVIIASETMLVHGTGESEPGPARTPPTQWPRLNQSQPQLWCFHGDLYVSVTTTFM